MNVNCTIDAGRLLIWRGHVLIGHVETDTNGEPIVVLTHLLCTSRTKLAFSDFDIIQDNWNQLQEMQKKS